MAKNIWGDISDEILEIGGTTAKGAGSALKASTVGVLQQVPDVILGTHLADGNTGNEKIGSSKPNFTKLDPDKLKKIAGGYEKQDDVKLEELRNRLFNMVKSDEKSAYQDAKQKENERLQKMMEEEQQKSQSNPNQLGELPQMTGKAKRGTTAQKVTKSSTAENKSDAGKQ